MAVDTFGVLGSELRRRQVGGFTVGDIRDGGRRADRLGRVGIGRHGEYWIELFELKVSSSGGDVEKFMYRWSRFKAGQGGVNTGPVLSSRT